MKDLPEDPVRLSNATLADLPDGVRRPTYDRSRLTAGIVHIGLGNFHRAHQAWYLHQLMQQGSAKDWAILGAGVMPFDAAMRARLCAQDCLTTLLELSPDDQSVEVTGAMIDYLPIEVGNAPLIAAMSDPAIRIVGLTVTEGGYYINPVTGGFDEDHPDIVHDIANPDTPRTCFGAMLAALRARRAAGHAPFTGLSCDNLQGNGTILRQTLTELARRTDPELADWISSHGAFPNSMVDCIVPATGDAERNLCRSVGIDDAAPVTHEPFRQWVIEDQFVGGLRPDWDLVGATFTDDVHSYETMKIRLLNAGHQVLANVGEVLSVDTIAECVAHPHIAALFRKVMLHEAGPHVVEVPGYSAERYVKLIEGRFANPRIHDTTRRVAFDGSARHTGFLLPSVRDALAVGTAVEGLALVEALWARMCYGVREDGSIIAPNDPFWEARTTAAAAAKERPRAWLEQDQVYGDLIDAAPFADALERWLTEIWDKGCIPAIDRYCAM